MDTDHGHFLVYGVTEELTNQVNFGNVGMDASRLIRIAEETGGIAVPAHPGRFGIGLYDYFENGSELEHITVVERLNGSNRPGEQERAEELSTKRGLNGTGGSDAHFVSAIGRCLTLFPGTIKTEEDMVAALKAGDFKAVRLDDTAEPFE